MSDQPDLSVIIVNYNTADLLKACLKTALAQQGVTFEVIVVDNASGDQSPEMVRSLYPEVVLLANKENLGFARANNQAAALAKGRFIYFLNPDTEVRSGCFAAMVKFMSGHPKVGMAGTAVFFPDNTPQSSVEYRYPGERHTRGDLQGLPGEIAWLLGASIVVRREIVARTGGFDERYFLYGEDVDLGLTVRKLGWELGYIADAGIIHWEGQSERQSLPAEVLSKKLAAERIFYQKHYSAQTIKRIKRSNRVMAAWRIATLSLCLPFVKEKAKIREKIVRYKLIKKAFALD